MSRSYLDVPTPNVKEFVVLSIHDLEVRSYYRQKLEMTGAVVMETDRFDEFFFLTLFEDCYLRLIDKETLSLNERLIAIHLESCLDYSPFVVVGNDIELPFQHRLLLRLQDVSWEWVEKVILEGLEFDRLEIARYQEAMKEFADE
jgi:hypothetical protein